MFRASVAQNPTMAVSDGTKKAMNSAVDLKRLGRARIGPSPPARDIAQASSASPEASRKGAAHASRNLMDSLPRTTTYMFHSQNTANAIHTPPGTCAQPGQAVVNIVWIAWPP